MTHSDEQEFGSPHCKRFSELIEQKWADERGWSAEDAEFYEQHKATCAECRDFNDLLEVMSNPHDDVTDASVSDLSIRRIVDRKFKNTRKRRLLTAAVAVAAGIAAVIAFTVRTPSADPQPGFALTKGGVILAGHSLDIGEHFSFSKKFVEIPMDTLIEIPKTLYIAMEEDAQIDAVDQTEETVHIRLKEGRIAVHLVPGSKLRVEVETEDGFVTVKGTVFVVEARNNTNKVSVIRGRVQVTPKRTSTQSRALDAGWAFSFGERKTSPRALMKEDHLLDLLGIPDPLPEPVKTDETAPKTDLRPNEAETTVSPANASSAPPPETLLQAAQECRAAKNWRCAVDNYGKLVNHYPGLPDAATAMIPIAQILLDNLNRPGEALQYFRRYQKRRPKGGLGQEAVYGECRALQQLGRINAEKSCLERYLEKYPNTVYTQMAKSRLMGIMVKD